MGGKGDLRVGERKTPPPTPAAQRPAPVGREGATPPGQTEAVLTGFTRRPRPRAPDAGTTPRGGTWTARSPGSTAPTLPLDRFRNVSEPPQQVTFHVGGQSFAVPGVWEVKRILFSQADISHDPAEDLFVNFEPPPGFREIRVADQNPGSRYFVRNTQYPSLPAELRSD